MKLLKGLLYAGLASAFLFAVSVPARADIVVTHDSGGGTVNVDGTAGGLLISNFNGFLTEINGTAVIFPAEFSDIDLVGTASDLSGTGTFTKTFGPNPDDPAAGVATLEFTIDSGTASGNFINLVGTITGITANSLLASLGPPSELYDFSKLVGGPITITVTKTGTDFATYVGDPTKSTTGAGFGFQQAAIPEPSSMALLGIGMTSFFAFRRFFRRTNLA